MSIESSSSPPHSRAVAGVNHDRGKKMGKQDAGVDFLAGGFSALINSLSAADPQVDSTVDAALPSTDCAPLEVGVIMPATQVNIGLSAITIESLPVTMPLTVASNIAATMTQVASFEQPELSASSESPELSASGGVAETALLGLPVLTGNAVSDDVGVSVPVQPSSLPAVVAGHPSATKTVPGRSDALENGNASALEKSTDRQLAAEQSFQSQKDSFLGQRSANGHAQALSAVQIELREVKSQTVVLQQDIALDVAAALNVLGTGDSLSLPKSHLAAKSGSSQGAAVSGFEGAFGAAGMGSASIDAAYKIDSPSAVVSDTSIAETVSYWVTHGVQSAELTLDGPENKPVEVSIVLNGDQAQIEFRTDQADMRQILESAKTQLKELLSEQGLQLAGVSVGGSGAGGASGDSRQQKSATRRDVWVSVPQAVAAVGRSANPSVGRTVDLFV